MPTMVPTEIKALARIVGELDYYQLLHLERGASPRDVKLAYHASSRAFHPDANRHLERRAARRRREHRQARSPRPTRCCATATPAGLRRSCSNPGGGVRIRLAEAASDRRTQDTETARRARTPQGRQYFNLALLDAKRNDWQAAARNLQTALTFEPDNEFFKSELAGHSRSTTALTSRARRGPPRLTLPPLRLASCRQG